MHLLTANLNKRCTSEGWVSLKRVRKYYRILKPASTIKHRFHLSAINRFEIVQWWLTIAQHLHRSSPSSLCYSFSNLSTEFAIIRARTNRREISTRKKTEFPRFPPKIAAKPRAPPFTPLPRALQLGFADCALENLDSFRKNSRTNWTRWRRRSTDELTHVRPELDVHVWYEKARC